MTIILILIVFAVGFMIGKFLTFNEAYSEDDLNEFATFVHRNSKDIERWKVFHLTKEAIIKRQYNV